MAVNTGKFHGEGEGFVKTFSEELSRIFKYLGASFSADRAILIGKNAMSTTEYSVANVIRER